MSAWGKSWGSSWLGAWGPIEEAPDEVSIYRKKPKTVKMTTRAMNVRRGYIKGKKLIP